MCGSKPKAPKPKPPTAAEAAAQQEATAARLAAEQAAQAQLSAEKQRTLQEQAAVLSGTVGARSLLTGRKGGEGFGGRSLLG